MSKPNHKALHEVHPQLWHYTNAVGVKAIIESQKLRATNISFLNDEEEHVGFFKRRLPLLLKEAAKSAAEDRAQTAEGREILDRMGGADSAVETIATGFLRSLRDTSLRLHNPYVMSFCTPTEDRPVDDGLLSQWRGYGGEGAYALIFESAPLSELLRQEYEAFRYEQILISNVEYYNQKTPTKATHPETLDHEKRLTDAARGFFLSGEQSFLDDMFGPVVALSCLHKHPGFAEESEVRIVALLPSNEVNEVMEREADSRQRKRIQYALRDGTMVPHIMLFEGLEPTVKLPISRVVVGPSRESANRKRAVELLCRENGVTADVVVSDIPFRGR